MKCPLKIILKDLFIEVPMSIIKWCYKWIKFTLENLVTITIAWLVYRNVWLGLALLLGCYKNWFIIFLLWMFVSIIIYLILCIYLSHIEEKYNCHIKWILH